MRWLGASQVPRMRLLGAGFSWLSRTYVDGDGDGGVRPPQRPIEFGRCVQSSSGPAIRDMAGPRAICSTVLCSPRVTNTQVEGELITTVCNVSSARVSTGPDPRALYYFGCF
jgi:hypothetical protein